MNTRSALKTAVYYFSAVVDSVILTSVVSTQLVLADIQGFGLDVSLNVRLHATVGDLLGLAVPLLLLVGLSFMIAFIIARYLHRLVGGIRTLWYMAAGFTSVPAAIVIIKYFMGGTLLASARTSLGMFLIACCCMSGGWLFAYLSSRFAEREASDA